MKGGVCLPIVEKNDRVVTFAMGTLPYRGCPILAIFFKNGGGQNLSLFIRVRLFDLGPSWYLLVIFFILFSRPSEGKKGRDRHHSHISVELYLERHKKGYARYVFFG